MQYVSQDIASNIYQASKYDDKSFYRDIIKDEIARLIVMQPSLVKSALIEAGISLPKKVTSTVMAELIQKNMTSNPRLRGTLSNIMLSTHKVPQTMNFEGYVPKTNGKKINKALVQTHSLMYDTMYFAFQNADSDPNATDGEDPNDVSIVDKIKAHQYNYDVITGKNKVKIGKVILLTSILSIGATIGGYFLTKYLIGRYKAKKFAEGGNLDLDSDGNQQTLDGQQQQASSSSAVSLDGQQQQTSSAIPTDGNYLSSSQPDIAIPNDGFPYDMSYMQP